MKKILCYVLAIFMCMSILPTAAFAAEQMITEVTLTDFIAPAIGEQPDFELTVPDGAHYHLASRKEIVNIGFDPDTANQYYNGICWHKSGYVMVESDTFTDPAKDAYYMDFILIPDSGYKFAKNPTITINGDTGLVKEWSGNGMDMTVITHNFTATSPVVINQVTLTDFTAPAIGEQPDFELTVPDGAHYHLASREEMVEAGFASDIANQSYNGICWYESGYAMVESDTFTNSEKDAYYMDFILIPDSGYKFAKDPTITINGDTGLVKERNVGRRDMTVITHNFTATSPVVINQVTLTGFTAPVIGEQPDFELTVPENAHYHLASREEMVEAGFASGIANQSYNGICWYESGYAMVKSDTFTNPAKDAYYMDFILIPDSGYKFAKDPTITINGDTGLVKEQNVGRWDMTVITHNFTATAPVVINQVTLTDFTSPVLGAQPDFELTVPENAHYHLASREEMVEVGFDPDTADQSYNGICWHESGYAMVKSDTFTNPAKDAYYMDFILIPDSGYKFTENTTITINGDTDLVKEQNVGRRDMTVITHNLTATPPVAINQVTITGFDKPVFGGTPDFDISVPDGATYHFATNKELNESFASMVADAAINGIWWCEGDMVMSKSDTFKNTTKDACWAFMVLVPNSGYEFADAVVPSINGDTTITKLNHDKTLLILETEHFTVTDPASKKESFQVSLEVTGQGELTANCNEATQGTEVTVAIKPKSGFRLDSVTVLDSQNNAVQMKQEKDNLTFTMPASKVTVRAAFRSEIAAFKDVSSGQWYFEHVNWAVENGITQGFPDGTFQPQANCTRSQIVTFLWRAEGSPKPKSEKNPFSDVSSTAWYYDAVLWAVENGVTQGFPDGTFQPQANCTRAQVVTFLNRAHGNKKAGIQNNPFKDVALDSWYSNSVLWAVEKSITEGFPDGTFQPQAECTRAQIVTFLHRAANQ